MKIVLLALAAALLLPSAASAAWSKSWVIEWYEPAMYFGGPDAKDLIAPGTDCPGGIHDIDWVKVMVEAGYSHDEAVWLRNPANPTRSPYFGQAQMAFRGKDRANIYIHPESTPESGDLKPVAGKIAEGFDLDGDKTNGFVSPTGEAGIDNNFYKALGCWKSYRGPPRMASNTQNNIDGMREGGWTVVIVASGAGNDPMNERDAKVGFYASPDKLVKDGNGGIARDYSFRIKPDARNEGVFKARIVKGKITTDAVPEMWIHDPDRAVDLQLLKAKASLEMQADGSLKGYLGGYRPWMPLYNGWLRYIGPSMEALGWVRLPDVWYSLKKFADYSPTGPGGEKTHISYAMRIDAVPAFVMAPDAHHEVTGVASFLAGAPAPKPLETAKLINGFTVPAPDGLTYEFKDEIMVVKGQPAVSQTAEQLKPPSDKQASAQHAPAG